MSRKSDKLNIIDHETYQKLHNSNESAKANPIRSAKYKRKHKNERPSLFDFLVRRRKKQNIKKNKKVTVLSSVRCPKRKGKSRLNPKPKVKRLKRTILNYRKWKARNHQEKQNQDEENTQALQEALDALSVEPPPSCEFLKQHVENKIQKLSIYDPMDQKAFDDFISLQGSSLKESANVATETDPSEALIAIPKHSRRFRSYCNHCKSARLAKLIDQMLRQLHFFQKRAYAINPIKANAHLRFVVGFRQAKSNLLISKVKLLIIATDCEQSPGKDGLDAVIDDLKLVCQQDCVPYCFPLERRQLSYALYKKAQISCVAILDYDGVNAMYKEILEVLLSARSDYNGLAQN